MPSVWKETARLPRFGPLEKDITTDVLIVGGGMAGLLCARLLKDRGLDCAVAEAGTVAGGTTGNTTAKLTLQHGLLYHKLLAKKGREGAMAWLKLQRQALERLCGMARSVDCDFVRADNWVYSLDDRVGLKAELAALNNLGVPARFAEELPLPIPTAGGVCVPEQAAFHPLKFLAAVCADLPVYEHTKVLELLPGKAVTAGGTVRAKHILLATHFPILNKHGGYAIKLYQHRSYVLALEGVPPLEGMYVDAGGRGLSFRMHGELLLLGGGGHRTGKSGGGWQVLEQFAAKYWPQAKIRARWAAQDCMSLDGLPYVGRYAPGTPVLWVATGFHKWGMTNSMAAAMVLEALIAGKDHPCRELLDPARSILHPQLASNLLESAVNLLRPTAPRCPHLGCALRWNAAERSWDCPCHGSRFDEAGRLLDGPATADKQM
ncbi:MAG: FAD-dependent oxidoreductase [Clostridia bacterium]|nr:FAD-dependent oxidoreductase [Clostridia bacterium]